jgi:hypothetical protein
MALPTWMTQAQARRTAIRNSIKPGRRMTAMEATEGWRQLRIGIAADSAIRCRPTRSPVGKRAEPREVDRPTVAYFEAFRAAGVPVDTPLGHAWAWGYRGKLTVEAIRAEWATVEP